MRKAFALLLIAPGVAAAVLVVLVLQGCHRDNLKTMTYQVFHFTTVQKSDILANINGDPNQPIVKPGQLYLKGSLILLNDKEKGIHIYDNSDPMHPVQKAFLNIPGNEGIAMRDNILFADAYCGLLAIDVSNLQQAKMIGVNWNMFSNRGYSSDSSNIVNAFYYTDTTMTVTSTSPVPFGMPMMETFASASAVQSANGTVGIAGSEAAMTLIGDKLYTIPQPHGVGVVDISNPARFKLDTLIYGAYDLETIFPLQDKLLLGSKEGVYIYSIANPSLPSEIGEWTHGRACDPVIADQNYAYVTLHSGSSCGGSTNELQILSGQDLTASVQIAAYPMAGPTGLGKDGNVLFVCDGPGVKVFDASDPVHLRSIGILRVEGATDVIAANHVLIVTAARGLFEFDYSDPGHIRPLGALTVK